MDPQQVLTGLIIGIIIGAGATYFTTKGSVSNDLIQEIETLRDALENSVTKTEYQNKLNEINDLELQLSDLQDLVSDCNIYKKYFDINGTEIAQYLMSEKAEYSWEEGFNNPDIQALIIVQINNDWANTFYEDIKKEYEGNGGAIVYRIVYPQEMPSSYFSYITAAEWELREPTTASRTNPIDVYGLEHIGVLLIGSTELCGFTSDVLGNETKYPMLNQLKWYSIGPITKLSPIQ